MSNWASLSSRSFRSSQAWLKSTRACPGCLPGFDVALDAIFGFSFKGAWGDLRYVEMFLRPREPFKSILQEGIGK